MGRYRRARLRDGEAGGATPTAVKGTLVLTQSTMTLRAFAFSTRPERGVVGISNGGPGSLRGPSVSIAYGSGSGWLTATVESVAGGWEIALEGDASALAAATYTATVTVIDTGASNSGAITCEVTFESLASPAVLKLQYATMDSFDAALGATTSTPTSDTVSITNAGPAGSTLAGPYVEGIQVQTANAVTWLNASISGSAVPYTLTIEPNSGIDSLAAGRHWATVRVGDATGASADLNVLIDIGGAVGSPTLNATPASLVFSAVEGAADPAAQTSSVTSTGTLAGVPTTTVSYQTAGQTWCTAVISGSATPYTLTVTCATGSLAPGTYSASVSIDDANVAAGASCAITFTVAAAAASPVIAVSPAPSPFQYRQTGATPTAQTATISNAGTGNLAGPTAASDVTWCTPTVSSNPDGTWTLTMAVVPGTLAIGTHTGTITVSDANAPSSVAVGVTLIVSAAASGSYQPPSVALCDGVTFNTTTGFLEGIPTGVQRTPPAHWNAAATHVVSTGAQFTAALAASASQDDPVIEITAGSTITGRYQIPPRTGSGFCVIRSSGYASLPATGTRVDPATDAANMATFATATTSAGGCWAMDSSNAVGNYWTLGIRFTATTVAPTIQYGLVSTKVQDPSTDANYAHDIYFDRCIFLGVKNCMRGLDLRAFRTGVYDSHLSNFWGARTECQAILMPLGGSHYFFDNNYLEANGECTMTGGVGLPSDVDRWIPRDLYFRRCYYSTQDAWNPRHASYNGTADGFKNLFELKRGYRATVDGCVFQKSFSNAQVGNAFQIKSAAQSSKGDPINQTSNRTEDFFCHLSFFRDIAACGIVNQGNTGAHAGEQPCERIQYMDCLYIRINKTPWNVASGGGSQMTAINNGRDTTATHLTAVLSGGTPTSSWCALDVNHNFVCRDNIFPQMNYGFTGAGTSEGTATLNAWCNGYTVTNNVLYAGSASTNYPAGNFFPATEAAVDFVDSLGSTPADFALAASSPYYNTMGADGRRIGADVARIATRTTGVY